MHTKMKWGHRWHVHVPHRHHIHVPHFHLPHRHHIHVPHFHVPHFKWPKGLPHFHIPIDWCKFYGKGKGKWQHPHQEFSKDIVGGCFLAADFPGHDIPGKTVLNCTSAEQCQAECLKVASCKYFTWSSSK